MIKYQFYAPSQIVQVSSVNSLVQTYPVVRQTQATLQVVSANFTDYNSQSLVLMSKIMQNTHKVLDWIASQINSTLNSVDYLYPMSLACVTMANQCSLVSIGALGTQTISMGISASNAFSILQSWDVVQNYKTPNTPDVLGNVMLVGLQNL